MGGSVTAEVGIQGLPVGVKDSDKDMGWSWEKVAVSRAVESAAREFEEFEPKLFVMIVVGIKGCDC